MPEKTISSKPVPMARSSLLAIYFAYLLSGISALIYQVAWQRILAIHSGVGIYSVAMIVAAFMAGLGFGSIAGAKAVESKRGSSGLMLFIVCEGMIALWGLFSCQFYYFWVGDQSSWMFSTIWMSGVVHFLALFVPTTLMGMSLPYLSQFVSSAVENAPRHIGLLYAANIFGAAVGALATPWIFIRFLGIENTVQLAATSNFIAALIGFALWRSMSPIPTREISLRGIDKNLSTTNENTRSKGTSLWIWMLFYGLSGTFSLALEVIWFRIIEVSVRATAFTFGTVLSIYLVGLGVGCFLGGRFARRVPSPLRMFLICQSAIIVYSGVAIWLMIRLPIGFPVYADLVSYWQSSEVFGLTESTDYYRMCLLYLVLPIGLYGLPTVLMGLSFGLLQQGVHREPSQVGLKVGLLQGANILGNVLGSLLAGLVLIHFVGTPRGVQLLLAAGLVFPLASAIMFADYRQCIPACMIGILLLTWPTSTEFWGRLHGVIDGDSYFAEDASGVMSITPADHPQIDYRVSMNGKYQSWLPFGGVHTELGVLAAMLHPNPQDAAIIGLGSGDTAWAAGCRPEIKELQVFEICAAEQYLLRDLASKFSDVGKLMQDTRISIINEDGRKALASSTRKYDLIEADALPPQCAYAGNIYSIEFFRLCASKLKPGGMMCQWAPTYRSIKTFSEAFEFVIIAPTNSIVIGSNDPIHLDLTQLRSRLAEPQIRSYLGEKNYTEMDMRIQELQPLTLPPDGNGDNLNTDLYPMDEFRAP